MANETNVAVATETETPARNFNPETKTYDTPEIVEQLTILTPKKGKTKMVKAVVAKATKTPIKVVVASTSKITELAAQHKTEGFSAFKTAGSPNHDELKAVYGDRWLSSTWAEKTAAGCGPTQFRTWLRLGKKVEWVRKASPVAAAKTTLANKVALIKTAAVAKALKAKNIPKAAQASV